MCMSHTCIQSDPFVLLNHHLQSGFLTISHVLSSTWKKLKEQLQPTKGFIRHQTPHPKRPSCVAPIHRESSLPDQILRPYRVNREKQMILHEAVQHHREVEQDCRGFSATKNSKNLKQQGIQHVKKGLLKFGLVLLRQ